MAKNPDPKRITDALWYFAQECLAMQPGTQYGGIVAAQPGYHGWRDWLIANGRSGDYSIRYAPDKLGPGDKSAAFDWTFPDAQSGRYGTIITYGARVREAWRIGDARAYGFREVLIQADADSDAEGYDFYLDSTRTPDDSHLWHGHFSVLRQFLNDFGAMNGMLSILAGESLTTWRAGQSRYGGTAVAPVGAGSESDMFVVEYRPASGQGSWWVSDGVRRRTAPAWWVVEEWRKITGRPDNVITDEASLTALAGPMDHEGDELEIVLPEDFGTQVAATVTGAVAEALRAMVREEIDATVLRRSED